MRKSFNVNTHCLYITEESFDLDGPMIFLFITWAWLGSVYPWLLKIYFITYQRPRQLPFLDQRWPRSVLPFLVGSSWNERKYQSSCTPWAIYYTYRITWIKFYHPDGALPNVHIEPLLHSSSYANYRLDKKNCICAGNSNKTCRSLAFFMCMNGMNSAYSIEQWNRGHTSKW